MNKKLIRLTESDLHRNESYEDLEDMPEYRPQGDKYYKYGVKGHTYKPDRYDYRTKKWDWGGVEYPYEEFDNIEDALKCYERFRKMENSVPQNVRIMGYYKTLGDDDWEYVNPNNIKESKNMNKIRLSETQLREVIKESVNKVLNEQSYRKSAKKGEHTSSALKHELNYQRKKGTYNQKDYHKFANKHGLNKRDVNTICDFEDGINGNGQIVRESSMNDGSSFKMMVWDAINQTLEKTFGDFSLGVGNGWDVTNPDNEDEYVHITFGGIECIKTI